MDVMEAIFRTLYLEADLDERYSYKSFFASICFQVMIVFNFEYHRFLIKLVSFKDTFSLITSSIP